MSLSRPEHKSYSDYDPNLQPEDKSYSDYDPKLQPEKKLNKTNNNAINANNKAVKAAMAKYNRSEFLIGCVEGIAAGIVVGLFTGGIGWAAIPVFAILRGLHRREKRSALINATLIDAIDDANATKKYEKNTFDIIPSLKSTTNVLKRIALGAAAGAFIGFILAPFTLGLSIPICAAIGAGCGLLNAGVNALDNKYVLGKVLGKEENTKKKEFTIQARESASIGALAGAAIGLALAPLTLGISLVIGPLVGAGLGYVSSKIANNCYENSARIGTLAGAVAGAAVGATIMLLAPWTLGISLIIGPLVGAVALGHVSSKIANGSYDEKESSYGKKKRKKQEKRKSKKQEQITPQTIREYTYRGTAVGAVLGAVIGIFCAPFTFGASIPVCILVGASIGGGIARQVPQVIKNCMERLDKNDPQAQNDLKAQNDPQAPRRLSAARLSNNNQALANANQKLYSKPSQKSRTASKTLPTFHPLYLEEHWTSVSSSFFEQPRDVSKERSSGISHPSEERLSGISRPSSEERLSGISRPSSEERLSGISRPSSEERLSKISKANRRN
jgi:F0F1-type ATP synthase assembly protein I